MRISLILKGQLKDTHSLRIDILKPARLLPQPRIPVKLGSKSLK